MNRVLIIINTLLLIAVGVLFYLHFSSRSKNETRVASSKTANGEAAAAPADFKIAYFEMDSIESSFNLVKTVKNDLNKKDEQINSEKNRLRKMYQDRIASYQQKAANMSQVESEQATRDIMQLEQDIKTKMQSMEQEFQDLSMRKTREVKTKIEEFLKEYNKDKRFAYIFVYEPGLIFYKDSALNITSEVIKGLNDMHGKKK